MSSLFNSEWRVKEFERNPSIVDINLDSNKDLMRCDPDGIFAITKLVFKLVAPNLSQNLFADIQELNLSVLIIVIRFDSNKANLLVIWEVVTLCAIFIIPKFSWFIRVLLSENELKVRNLSSFLVFIPFNLS